LIVLTRIFLLSSGAIEIGTLLSGVLFGLITAQTYVYFKSFPRDPRFTKGLVSVPRFRPNAL
jgi:hypothetical protein